VFFSQCFEFYNILLINNINKKYFFMVESSKRKNFRMIDKKTIE